MITISLCMIVRDEQEVLNRCLESAAGIYDELIIVDTGSLDNTVTIAKGFTENVKEFLWIDDFAAARNYAFSFAAKEYLMWLDADDVISENDRLKLLELKETLNPSADMVYMTYKVGGMEYFRERIIKNMAAGNGTGRVHGFWQGAIHETISPFGEIVYADIAITHSKIKPGDPKRNLKIFEKMLRQGKKFCPREQYYYARELMWNGETDAAAELMEIFLKEPEAWVENLIDACKDLYYMTKKAEYLYRTFEFGTPRAEVCCELGGMYFNANEYSRAAWWYKSAIDCQKSQGGFNLADCYDFVPFLQLCVCYDRLAQASANETERAVFKKLAKEYHEKSKFIKPNDDSVLFNEKYFSEGA